MGIIDFAKSISFKCELILLVIVGENLPFLIEFFLFNHLAFLYLVFLFRLFLLYLDLCFILSAISFLISISDKYITSLFSFTTALPISLLPVSTPNVNS